MIKNPNDNPGLHHRRSIRLPGSDYSQNNAYFITICTKNREPKFGEIIDDKIVLNMGGTVAEKCWLEIPNHFPNVVLDEFIIMPNHVYGIIVIQNVVGVQNLEPLPDQRYCADNYVHDYHQAPFSKHKDTKSFFFWLFMTLGVPAVLIGLIIYALFRWVF